jgi:hypothetical protein
METANFTVSDNREVVGRHATLPAAQRACRNDMGRHLLIHDGMSRVRGHWLDGRDLDAGLDPQGTAPAAGHPASAGTCGICRQSFTLLYPLAQYSTVEAGSGERLPVCDDCDDEMAA